MSWMGNLMDGGMHGWMGEHIGRQKARWITKRVQGCMDVCMHGSMEGMPYMTAYRRTGMLS